MKQLYYITFTGRYILKGDTLSKKNAFLSAQKTQTQIFTLEVL